MARSLLRAFINGARGILSTQLFISVGAVALAGWTLAVTNQVMRERDLMRERVIQLEASMAERGIVVPSTQTVVVTPTPNGGTTLYPGEVGATALSAPSPVSEEGSGDAGDDASTAAQPDFSQVISTLFAPAPPMRVVVLHVRAESDAAPARAIAGELSRAANVHVVIDVIAARDGRQNGYSYFDGRQNRAAADLVTQFHDIARNNGVASWSAQLRGTALPAQGEYTADRLDLVLPPLPPPPTPVEPAATPAPERAG
jgi:hypothetical protein